MISIVLIGIITISSSNIINLITKQNYKDRLLTIDKIDLEATQLFLQNKITTDNQLTNLTYKQTTLFYNNNILLKDISSYNKTITSTNIELKICIKKEFEICHNIVLLRKVTN